MQQFKSFFPIQSSGKTSSIPYMSQNNNSLLMMLVTKCRRTWRTESEMLFCWNSRKIIICIFQLSDNAKSWARERSDLRAKLRESEHGLSRNISPQYTSFPKMVSTCAPYVKFFFYFYISHCIKIKVLVLYVFIFLTLCPFCSELGQWVYYIWTSQNHYWYQ